ncbi:MAG: hypothetical protein ABJ382_20345, partial [Ilumatobacter sp.]
MATVFIVVALFLPVSFWIKGVVVAQAVLLAALARRSGSHHLVSTTAVIGSEDREQLMWATLTRECGRATRLDTSVAVFALDLGAPTTAERAVRVLASSVRETDLALLGPRPGVVLAAVVIPRGAAAPTTLNRLSQVLSEDDLEVARFGTAVFPHDHATPEHLVDLAVERMAATPYGRADGSQLAQPSGDDAEPTSDQSRRTAARGPV